MSLAAGDCAKHIVLLVDNKQPKVSVWFEELFKALLLLAGRYCLYHEFFLVEIVSFYFYSLHYTNFDSLNSIFIAEFFITINNLWRIVLNFCGKHTIFPEFVAALLINLLYNHLYS